MPQQPSIHLSKIPIVLVGKSGRDYDYWVYSISESLRTVPGNIVYAKETDNRRWNFLFISQAADLSNPWSYGNLLPTGVHTATHVFAHQSDPDQLMRIAEVRDLLAIHHISAND